MSKQDTHSVALGRSNAVSLGNKLTSDPLALRRRLNGYGREIHCRDCLIEQTHLMRREQGMTNHSSVALCYQGKFRVERTALAQ